MAVIQFIDVDKLPNLSISESINIEINNYVKQIDSLSVYINMLT
jgi:hypothetical protein